MRDFEYLVIDDGSTDDTEEVVQSFSDERIKYHKLSENSGNQVVPNNYALERARGYFIAYLGHDDLWCKNHLDVALAGLSGFTQMVYTIAVLYTRRTLLTGITEDGKYRRLMSLPMSSVVHTSQLYREIGPWRSRREQWDDTGEYTAPMFQGSLCLSSHQTGGVILIGRVISKKKCMLRYKGTRTLVMMSC
jgi:glycosyltransferase involved in cell wall biosynthesis